MTFYVRRPKYTTVRRTGNFIYPLLILVLIAAVSLLACTPRVPTATPANEQPPVTFTAEADAQVYEDQPDTNAGTSALLQVEGGNDPNVESFIRFTVTGVSAPIQNARLRLYNMIDASRNGPVVYATDISWSETEITWNNRPARVGEELDNLGSTDQEAWEEYDVTAAVTGNGTFSFVLVADSTDAAKFSSREGSQPPQLVITLAGSSTPTLDAATAMPSTPNPTATSSAAAPEAPIALAPEADARVSQSDPNTNFGTAPILRVDGTGDSEVESFLRFTVPKVPGPIQSAQLRLYVTDNGTENGPAVYATDNSWGERSIKWNNRPEPASNALDNKGNLTSNSWVEYDVTSIVTGSGMFSFVLIADSSDGVVFSSREGDQPPQLVLNFTGGNAATAVPTPAGSSGDVILVGAGDISECDNDNDELTAQLLDAIPGTVFTTGDNAYRDGTIEDYNTCYGPTWGRHKDRTKPIPGNHDYNSDAAGYFEYFNNIPEYYAYDLGSWRIYALNSEIDVSENSAQVIWLQVDLAANPRQCVLAYWHQPRWSSGSRHSSGEDFQTLWQVLYEAGAELVMNGHEHNYERFAEMNAEGVVVSPGLREFVVGTGGGGLYDFATPLPASEARNDSAYGVLKLTLRAASYAWEFIPIAGSTFTDSGSTNCH